VILSTYIESRLKPSSPIELSFAGIARDPEPRTRHNLNAQSTSGFRGWLRIWSATDAALETSNRLTAQSCALAPALWNQIANNHDRCPQQVAGRSRKHSTGPRREHTQLSPFPPLRSGPVIPVGRIVGQARQISNWPLRGIVGNSAGEVAAIRNITLFACPPISPPYSGKYQGGTWTRGLRSAHSGARLAVTATGPQKNVKRRPIPGSSF